VIALISVVALAGCAAAAPTPAPTATGMAASSAPPSPHTSAAPVLPSLLSTLLEPDAGIGVIYGVLGSARRAVDLVMYELEDTRAEQLLAGAAARGVDVKVMLNRAYIGSANDAAFAYLQGHGVHVRWAGSLYALTHQKTLLVDGLVGVIMSLNWTSRYYANTRDVAVIDRTPSDVAAMQATFNADFDGTRIDPASGADLVWSPTTSLPDLLALIQGATRELFVENEEMANPSITSALIDAARRGVNVQICMTDSSSWSSAFAELAAAGVHLRVYSPDAALYIHAKVLVRDPGASDQEAFSGSQNFSTESLRYNRELGIVLHSGTLVKELQAMIQRDFSGAAPWTG
jgi:cardiolipin synthase A/B